MGRFNAGGSSGGGFVPNLQLGAEQSVVAGVNERTFNIGGGQAVITPQFTLDAANPTHLFKITHVQIIVGDVAPIATLVQVGVIGVDAIPPVVAFQEFYGRSIAILPLQDTTMKIAIVTNDVINGDTPLVSYQVANGNLSLRRQNATGAVNRMFAKAVNDPWEKIDNVAWTAVTWGDEFHTIFFRRIRAQ